MKTDNSLWFGLIFAGVLGILSMTPAEARQGTPSAALAALDVDKDGTLSWNEVRTAAAAKFNAANPDKDGTLDVKGAAKLGIGARLLHKADPDKDGTLDQKEFLAIVKQRFEKADTDHDGTLSASELSSRSGRALLRLIR